MADDTPKNPQPHEIDMRTITTEELARIIFNDFEMWAVNFAVFKGITGQPVAGMKLNKLQLRAVEHYRRCQIEGVPCLIMILKPRQKGASTIAEAIAYFHMRRYPNLNGVLMGDVQSTSDKVFEMYRRYAEGDAFPWPDGQPNIKAGLNLADEITLASGSKWWKETAGSSNAGRSGTAQVLHMDEVAYFPSSPTKDPTTAVLGSFYKEAPYSLGFATSTANGASGWFHDTYMGQNDWQKIFAAWFEFDDAQTPFKTDEARQMFERSMTHDEVLEQKVFGVTLEQLHWRRKKIMTDYKGDVGKFRQEYPSSAQGAFLSSSRMRFDEEALADMLAWAKSNDNREVGNLVQQGRRGVASWVPDMRGDVIRWEEPRYGCRYVVSMDTCTGEDQQIGGTTADPDWHSAQVWRQGYAGPDGIWIPPALVALHCSRLEIDIAATVVAAMSAYYGHCLIIPEVNNSGLAIVKALERLGCNIFRRQANVQRRKIMTEDERLEAYGWSTDKLTKKLIIDVLAPMIRAQEIQIRSKEVIEQCQSFIITANGTAQAAPSKHDDHVMSAAIALYNLGAATEYKLGGPQRVDQHRLRTDNRYLAPEGFRRKLAG